MIRQDAVVQFRLVALNLKPIASGTLAYFVEKLQGSITGLVRKTFDRGLRNTEHFYRVSGWLMIFCL
jgi:hypothetical protein